MHGHGSTIRAHKSFLIVQLVQITTDRHLRHVAEAADLIHGEEAVFINESHNAIQAGRIFHRTSF
jgi:hypothetical protein